MIDRRALLAASAGLLATPALVRAQAPEPMTVLLDWFVNPDHATLVIARDRGFFRQAGLEVTLVPPQDPSAPPRLVAARQADIAVSYQPPLHLQVNVGLPLVRVGSCVATPRKCGSTRCASSTSTSP